jgi:ABC-type glycerol-3-phosphate transport system permease component
MTTLEQVSPVKKVGGSGKSYKSFHLSAGQVIVYTILLVGIIYTLIPFLWMVATSFKSSSEIVRMPPTLIPEKATLNSYISIFNTRACRWDAFT